jgi:nitrate reductase (NAD(P)H)
MMPSYHIGSLDEASKKLLSDGESADSADAEPRETFLQSKAWTKAVLSSKTKISADTKIFTFDLEHASQTIGLPIGQHLMMRLRDPATKETIIRAYTPISEGTDRGRLHVLVKIYYDSPDRKGGKMTQVLDATPVGDAVDFKGPVGKFEYLGRGRCTIAGRERLVKRFIMICGGSGVTPIFQVIRAVMKDPQDPTECLVLDGNRVEEDILCRADLDKMAAENPHKCRLLYALTRPEATWTGLKGRMDRELFEREVGPCGKVCGDDLVLICGPESMEKSVHQIFRSMGWADEDLLFF